jgi:hypothetical protein
VPAVGRYDYALVIPSGTPFGAARTLAGSVTITQASDDALTGAWAVPGITTTALSATWNVDAYFLTADLEGFGDVTHRLTPSGGGLACTARLVGIVNGALVSHETVCTLVRP